MTYKNNGAYLIAACACEQVEALVNEMDMISAPNLYANWLLVLPRIRSELVSFDLNIAALVHTGNEHVWHSRFPFGICRLHILSIFFLAQIGERAVHVQAFREFQYSTMQKLVMK